MQLILGSASARRRELLEQSGIPISDIRPADIDETPRKNEPPRTYVNRIARAKATALPALDGQIILCADTTVCVGRRILGKPQNAQQAGEFLNLMSGRRHKVITALAVKTSQHIWHRDVISSVKMKRLSHCEIAAYIATDEWMGKAGGYAIQGRAGAFIPWISGSYTAIMGLPLTQTLHLLKAAGMKDII